MTSRGILVRLDFKGVLETILAPSFSCDTQVPRKYPGLGREGWHKAHCSQLGCRELWSSRKFRQLAKILLVWLRFIYYLYCRNAYIRACCSFVHAEFDAVQYINGGSKHSGPSMDVPKIPDRKRNVLQRLHLRKPRLQRLPIWLPLRNMWAVKDDILSFHFHALLLLSSYRRDQDWQLPYIYRR